MRLESLLAGHALRRPDREALICGEIRVSYSALQDSVSRAAAGLHRLGVRPGDRVLLCLPNGVELVQLCYAAFTVGATVVPVNTRLTANEIEHIARDCQPAVIAYHASGREVIRAAMPQAMRCPAVAVGGAGGGEVPFEQLLAAPASRLPEIPVERDDCLILYTSGTTGEPKGAVNTHANMIVQNVYLCAREWGIGADERALVVTPIAHRAGCARMIIALGLGGTLVIMEKFDPVAALALIERERVTLAGLVPTALRMMLPHIREHPAACDSLRTIVVATEAFPPPLKKELIALLPRARIYSLFGSSECLVTSLSHDEQLSHPASVGRPIPGIEVRLADDAGRDVAQGEVGELLVRDGVPGRGAVMKEYFNRPEETAAALANGWFHTGDLARCDDAGYLYIVDRKKDMVLSGGYNIYSKEVEEALRSHPGVADAAVIGVPDETFGEAVAAFVEHRGGARPAAGELIEHCRAQLASYKKPKHVFFIESLPRNSVGKVLKSELRALAARDMNQAPA